MKLVTLCGSYNLHLPWVDKCIASWDNLEGIEKPYYVIPDALLKENDRENLEKRNIRHMADKIYLDKIDAELNKYPSLKKIRDLDLTWRKIIDTLILFEEEKSLLLIDTDVLIIEPVQIQSLGFDFIYLSEDIPAYRGRWDFPFRHKFFPALNAGFMYLNPSKIEMSFLEDICSKYFLNLKQHWWSEQSAWSILFAELGVTGIFKGTEVCVISGFLKRSPKQVHDNDYVFWGNNKLIEDEKLIKEMAGDAKVIHFAGMGKKWIDFFEIQNNKTPYPLQPYPARLANTFEKTMISLRLLYKEVRG